MAETAAAFEREQGITEEDWLRCLPAAAHGHGVSFPAPGCAHVALGAGTLRLQWQVLPQRQIALIRLPRLAVRYAFVGVDEPARSAFMRRFDLYLQRGGG